MYPTNPQYPQFPAPAPKRTGLPGWAIALIVLGAVFVMAVGSVAAVTLLGANAQQKFDKVGRTVSTDTTDPNYDPSLDTNGDGEITVDDIPAHSEADCARWDADDSMDSDTWNLCIATAY